MGVCMWVWSVRVDIPRLWNVDLREVSNCVFPFSNLPNSIINATATIRVSSANSCVSHAGVRVVVQIALEPQCNLQVSSNPLKPPFPSLLFQYCFRRLRSSLRLAKTVEAQTLRMTVVDGR